jgi:hypothetical protein
MVRMTRIFPTYIIPDSYLAGPMVYLKLASQGLLILNTQEVVLDLLEKRGSMYDDRPRFISEYTSVSNDLLDLGLLSFSGL